jgi:hypothetical protein
MKLKTGSYDDFFQKPWYWGLKSPWTITFDPEGVRAYVLHKSCWKKYALMESAEKL